MVHEIFSEQKILKLKERYPDALVIAHPECEEPVLKNADYIGSTTALLKYTQQNNSQQFIVATEAGIIYQMQKASPAKEFIPAPPEDSTCACNDCNFMKLNTMEKLYNALKYELPEIILDDDTIAKAYKPIRRMLDLSEKMGI